MSRSPVFSRTSLLGFVTAVVLAAAACNGSSATGAGGGGGGAAACMSTGSAGCPVACDPTRHPGAQQGTACAKDGETCMSMEPACGQTCTLTCQNGVWGPLDCTMISPTC